MIYRAEWDTFEVVEAECPELEEVLRRGGLSENGYDVSQIIAVEKL